MLKPIILPIFAPVRRTVPRNNDLKLTFMKTSIQLSPAPGRYIDLMFDRGFKRVFGKPANKDILIAFLNEVIPDKHIVDLTYLNTEKEGLGPESHKSVFDVQCT